MTKRTFPGSYGLPCPKCGYHTTGVIDSREAPQENAIRRRRQCRECSYRFTTKERIAGDE